MAVTKRIFQLSKEFERDEKEIIAFLTEQGIKVSNRLSAVSEEAYKMLQAKFLAPPEPEPEPEPEPSVQPAQQEQALSSGKKKKKKNKAPQPVDQEDTEEEQPVKEVSDAKIESMEKRTQTVLFEAIKAGNEFISCYNSTPGQSTVIDNKRKKANLTWNMDTWAILFNHKFDYPDSSPVRYWQAVAKLMTRAFKIINAFGMDNREALAKMRDTFLPLGTKYQPREIFTDEENQKFAEQQTLLFHTFGHGMGLVNENLFALKLKAERMKVEYERMNFLEYTTNPQAELRSNERVPFSELAEAVAYSARGIARRFDFYCANKKRIDGIIKKFFEWIDGYAKLKEQGADAAKLEKYLELEEKFISIVEFMSFDNLLSSPQNKPQPFDVILKLLQGYRDNMDDPDAERNFKYKVRGVTNVVYKPKEYVFIYQFAGLEPQKDYRPPEEIAASKKESPAKDEA